MRSFHATVEAGSDSSCESLGLTNEHVEVCNLFFGTLSRSCLFVSFSLFMVFGRYYILKHFLQAIQNFFCKNCQYKRHQCFCCGELGSSDKSSGAEV